MVTLSFQLFLSLFQTTHPTVNKTNWPHLQNRYKTRLDSHCLQIGLRASPWTHYSQTQEKSLLSSKPPCLPLSLWEKAKTLTLPYSALHDRPTLLSDLQLCCHSPAHSTLDHTTYLSAPQPSLILFPLLRYSRVSFLTWLLQGSAQTSSYQRCPPWPLFVKQEIFLSNPWHTMYSLVCCWHLPTTCNLH